MDTPTTMDTHMHTTTVMDTLITRMLFVCTKNQVTTHTHMEARE